MKCMITSLLFVFSSYSNQNNYAMVLQFQQNKTNFILWKIEIIILASLLSARWHLKSLVLGVCNKKWTWYLLSWTFTVWRELSSSRKCKYICCKIFAGHISSLQICKTHQTRWRRFTRKWETLQGLPIRPETGINLI